MKTAVNIFLFVLVSASMAADKPVGPVWPPSPDTARVAFLGEIKCDRLSPKAGFLGKLTRLIGGRSEEEQLLYPFDIAVGPKSLFMIFQNLPALVEINRDDMTFRLHRCNDAPFVYPVSLCRSGDDLFITDPEAGAVYRFSNGKVSLFINQGLIRPTGIAALPAEEKLYVIDTGDHTMKIFDFQGRLIKMSPDGTDSTLALHYPTFAASTGNEILVNDGLNYRIRRFDPEGRQVLAFGEEGDGPGSLARPKGLAVDSDGHVYVVDNIFDNIQIFDAEGQLLLVIGTTGREFGQFWSPVGIDIVNDTIFIADMFNNRVQIMHYLGDSGR